ncbi:MAG: tetratricopeptide repeat protein, partial [Myxococcota bacterium]
ARGAPYVGLEDPAFGAHHNNHRGVALYLQRDYARALAVFDEALALAPDSASLLNNRATTLLAQGEPSLAAAEAMRAVELRPAVPLYRYQLGRALMQGAALEDAAACFSEALRLAPRYGLARRELGWSLLLRGDIEGAERELVRAVRDEPTVPEVSLYLGLFYLARGDVRRAREVTQRAVVRAPDDAGLLALAELAGTSSSAGAVDPAVRAELVARVESLRRNIAAVRKGR